MAGLCGLKTVLLWVVIVGLASCQSTGTTPSPPRKGPVSEPPTIASSSLSGPVSGSPTTTSPPRTSAATTATTSLKTTLNSTSTVSTSSVQSSSLTTTSVAPPANISNETSSALNSSSTQSPPPTSNQTTISPPDTQNTTIIPPATAATPPPPPSCNYTVAKISSGFQITVKNIPTDYNIISIAETGRPENEVKDSNVSFSKQSSTHQFINLKPCTDYQLNVTFIDINSSKTICSSTENKKTSKPREQDITYSNCDPGYICYRSDWNISSSQLKHNNDSAKWKNGGFNFELKNDDFCSNFTVNFTPENCKNSSFTFTKYIPFEFINPNEINQCKPTGLPAEIETELPPNCQNLSVEYTCSGPGSVNLSLSDLEPFTNYSCTGLIKNSDGSTLKTLPPVEFNIDCELKIENKQTVTNTSIELKWETTSKNCGAVLLKLKELSYTCSCEDNKRNEGSCKFDKLEPFTDYTCEVQPTYKNFKVSGKKTIQLKTKPGVPDPVDGLTLTIIENNGIRVICKKPNHFKGPDKVLIARLDGGKDVRNHTCEFEFKDLSYLTSYKVEVVADNGDLRSEPKTERIKTSYNDKALIGFLAFLIILTSLALLLVLYKIYVLKRRKSHNLSENMRLIPTNEEESLMPVEPIAGELLLETYKRKLADEGRLFLAEFQSIPRIFSRYTVKEAKQSCNSPKNRYVDILPYDYNRVQLSTGNGSAGCDYINASFIDGYKEPKKYIAAQGPKEETLSDFWRMVWEQQSSIIVMVTRCEEGNRAKCAQYWPSPERETEIYEEFIVKMIAEDHCPDYTIRHLSLINKREKNTEREVTHIQFISWPDHGVPGEPHLLLKLRRRVNAFKNFFSGPIVVHCSAGVGRTGTYIGIDAMMEGLEAEGRVDIYGYVVRLRRQRCLMVQVEAQYILIHQALLEHNQFGETEISLSELHGTLSTLQQKNSDSEPTLMEDEFERLPTFKNWRTCNTGLTEENKKKNRSSSVIPYDYNRVMLKVDEGRSQDSNPEDEEEEDSSDEEDDEDSARYINASHIHGYWGPNALITAQNPLPDTFADFWAMVYQKKVQTVVMVSENKEDSEPDYWSKEKETFGDFEVEVTSTEISPIFISRKMQLHHVKRKESRLVKHFQFLNWEGTELPEKPQDLIDMIKDIRKNCVCGKSQRGVPIVVHCNDGSSRSGVFCALWNLMDSAETEKLVDVFQVVKTLRKERRGMIPSLEQYQFIYNALGGAFPVQNGEVKPVKAAAADCLQIVDETKAAEKPAEAEQPAGTPSGDQQEAAESAPLVAQGEKETKTEEPAKETSPPTESSPLEETSNGPTATVEV
ncbi:receptor-type tyrosine-protein phosphatase C isoform X2 [Kryptolebias marmoratus]|uniref:receptor-type tyrosine-protein phosphatase C isoform X2 n=1 Tax=Kryptolebias marmoratus TaxID=37003 RepID=UPI0007F8815D|nr:receptor-type tyrosine-protein phosphatase C isoform X2 [Kryptolebias marmoratus]